VDISGTINQFFPQIQAIFASQGITITLPQAEIIAAELTALLPVSIPTIPVPPTPPVGHTLPSRDQVISYYQRYLGRIPENELAIAQWMTDWNAENDIKDSPEASLYAQSQARTKVILTGNWGGNSLDARAPGLRTALVSGLIGEAAVNLANSIEGGGYAFESDKNVYAIPVPPGGYILLNGEGGYDYAPGDSGNV
jgi:hypothetical protein